MPPKGPQTMVESTLLQSVSGYEPINLRNKMGVSGGLCALSSRRRSGQEKMLCYVQESPVRHRHSFMTADAPSAHNLRNRMILFQVTHGPCVHNVFDPRSPPAWFPGRTEVMSPRTFECLLHQPPLFWGRGTCGVPWRAKVTCRGP